MHKNLSIELEISPELPEWVVGDQQRLRQVCSILTMAVLTMAGLSGAAQRTGLLSSLKVLVFTAAAAAQLTL